MKVAHPFDILTDEEADLVEDEAFPDWLAPMLATLVDEPFSNPDWIYERKLDGERCLAYVGDSDPRLMSRNRKDVTPTYPELAEALAASLSSSCVLDGEVVAFEGRHTSFQRLQGRMQVKDPDEARASSIAVYFYLFDVLHLEGSECSQAAAASSQRDPATGGFLRRPSPVHSSSQRAG